MKIQDGELRNEYTMCFRYVMLVMKTWAIYPFFPLHEVMNISQILSMILTCISVPVYLWATYTELMVTLPWLYYFMANSNHISTLRNISATVNKSLFLMIPFFTWGKNKQLRNYRNNWRHFEIELEKLTKGSFHCSVRYKILGLFTIVMLIVIVFCSLLALRWDFLRSPTRFFTFTYTWNGSSHLMNYWIANNMFTISSMKKLINAVQRSIDEENEENLRRLIDLWIMVCDLIDEFIYIHANLFLVLFCLIITIGTANTFIAIVGFIYYRDNSIGFTYLSGIVFQIISIVIFCESANSVTEYMVHKLRKILLDENVNKKNRNMLYLIDLFLQTIETKNPQINFNGYMTVNRSRFYEIIGAAINILIVMKSFVSTI